MTTASAARVRKVAPRAWSGRGRGPAKAAGGGAWLLVCAVVMFPFLAAFDPVRSRSGAVEEGNAKMKAGKADEALAAYDKAISELPQDPAAHFDRERRWRRCRGSTKQPRNSCAPPRPRRRR